MNPFDLLILDLDGTLVDSEAILVGMVNATLSAHGYPCADARAVAATIGLPLDEVFQRALPADAAAAIPELCVNYRRRADAPEFVSQFRLYPGVMDTLAALRAAGKRLVVGTSKARATTRDIVRHCAIQHLIDEVIGGDCVTRGKPHPEMLERARALFGTPAQRTLMVGDTSFDIEMGQAAGVATCAVTYGMHAADTLRALAPDFVIDRFESLSHLVIR
ncbi:MAG: HAD-IA family hydrolase [Deltaproteobacteria bacterium]|nr:HAD-IA family hydrolase [Deltaproteobacteria bacterium]